MTATRGAAFTTAVRMVDRVHGHTAGVRADAEPARTSGLAQVDVAMVRVGHGADGRHAGAQNAALFTGHETQDRVTLVTADDLNESTGGTGDLTALARLQLNVVDNGADRNGSQRHCVARLHVDGLTSHNHVTGSKTLRGQDVGQLAILVTDQRDESGAVRIVFQALDSRRNVELATLEVHQTVGALVATTAVRCRQTAAVVALPSQVNYFQVTTAGSFFAPQGFVPGKYEDEANYANPITYFSWDYESTTPGTNAGPYDTGLKMKFGPSSRHPAVINCAFGDGSVRSVAKNVDQGLLMFIVTRAGSDPNEYMARYGGG